MSWPTENRFGIVVPIRSLKKGKSRLLAGSDILRQQLVLAFFLDTVSALTECESSVGTIVVVSSDETISEYTGNRCEVVADNETGLTEAIDIGVKWLLNKNHPGPVAIVLPDLPYANARAFDAYFDAARKYRNTFLVDSAGCGTTCVTSSSAAEVVHRFGPNSARAHIRAGLKPLDIFVPELRSDVDRMEDLYEHRSMDLGTSAIEVFEREWRCESYFNQLGSVSRLE